MGGQFYCLGAPLARLEAEIAIAGFFDRFPHARLAVDPSELTKQTSLITNDYTRLPVHLGH
ncbi:hypothetical protein AB0I28_32680 [Phytomonospora sp. NPDC050363]|uniref:hypothetical protein n=1 Tax=Phytomonospora sp. NPDC050363 TaxID=3155642 RepID=UPI0033C18B16